MVCARVDLVIAVDDPRADDVRALLAAHLSFAHAVTPPGHVHAFDVEALIDPAVTFFSARREGELVGVAALKRLDESHVELKSMHTTAAARRGGVGSALVARLLAVAADQGYRRVSLETGTGEAFAAAHALYRKAGFVPCEPFAGYTVNPYSSCMTITVPAYRQST